MKLDAFLLRMQAKHTLADWIPMLVKIDNDFLDWVRIQGKLFRLHKNPKHSAASLTIRGWLKPNAAFLRNKPFTKSGYVSSQGRPWTLYTCEQQSLCWHRALIGYNGAANSSERTRHYSPHMEILFGWLQTIYCWRETAKRPYTTFRIIDSSDQGRHIVSERLLLMGYYILYFTRSFTNCLFGKIWRYFNISEISPSRSAMSWRNGDTTLFCWFAKYYTVSSSSFPTLLGSIIFCVGRRKARMESMREPFQANLAVPAG